MVNSISPLEELRAESERLQRYFANDQQALLEGITDKVIPLVNSVVSSEVMPLKDRHLVGGDDDGKALVVHYTSIDTVIKMFRDYIEKGRSYLRLYDTFHFNDPDEGKYLINRLDPTNHTELKALIDNDAPCAYVSSFIIPDDSQQSKGVGARDNLVFWRTYGREGTGCSIVMRVSAARLFKVRYGVGEEDTLLIADKIEEVLTSRKSIIMEAIKPILDVSFDNSKKVLNRALNLALSKEVESIFYLYKSRYYDYEKEARIIKTVPSIKAAGDEIFFEDNSGTKKIRHYCNDESLSVRNLLTTGSVITLGPCVSDKENIAYYLEHLKEKSGLVGPRVIQSTVSYRSSS